MDHRPRIQAISLDRGLTKRRGDERPEAGVGKTCSAPEVGDARFGCSMWRAGRGSSNNKMDSGQHPWPTESFVSRIIQSISLSTFRQEEASLLFHNSFPTCYYPVENSFTLLKVYPQKIVGDFEIRKRTRYFKKGINPSRGQLSDV